MESLSRRKTVLVVSLLLVFLAAGCLRYIRYDALPDGDLQSEAEQFLEDFERVYELENRYLLRTLIDGHFAGGEGIPDRLVERMAKIFNQYREIELSIRDVDYRRMSRSLIVKFNWDLTWTCEDINPSRGCKDYNGDGRPDTINRTGRTIFTLVYQGDQWYLKNEEGDLLVGAYSPGYRSAER